MGFSKLLESIFRTVNEDDSNVGGKSKWHRSTAGELQTEIDFIKSDLEENPEHINLKQDLEELLEEQEIRRQAMISTTIKGPLVASRRIDFSKYSDEDLEKLSELGESNPEEFKMKFVVKGIALADFEVEQALDDIVSEIIKRDKSEEEFNNEEINQLDVDKTKPEGWNFYGYETNELKELQSLTDPELKQKLDIETDEELVAAKIEIVKVLGEYESWSKENESKEQRKQLKNKI